MNEIKLDDRLMAIVKLLGPLDIVVDVGCDHGYVANYLIENNLSKKVYATDISNDSLDKNREFSKKRGNEKKIISVLGDGLKPIEEEFDGVVIAGMGGELIKNILEESKEKIEDKILILQPMTGRVELRKYLSENGFMIEKEAIVKDKDKFYEIIKAVPGNGYKSTSEFYFGNNLVEDCDPILIDYVENYLEKTERYLEKAKSSKTKKGKGQQEDLKREIKIFKGVLDECKR